VDNKEKKTFLPVMLFDGECGFCRRWIEKWERMTAERVRYEPYQEAYLKYPALTQEQCRAAVQLILPDGRVFSGAHAVFMLLTLGGRNGFFLWAYDRLRLFALISEWFYQMTARHRPFLSRFYGARKCRVEGKAGMGRKK
jgi:lipase maturation factor 1